MSVIEHEPIDPDEFRSAFAKLLRDDPDEGARRFQALWVELGTLREQHRGAVDAVRAHYDGWVKANGRASGNMRPADRELWMAVLGPEFGGQ